MGMLSRLLVVKHAGMESGFARCTILTGLLALGWRLTLVDTHIRRVTLRVHLEVSGDCRVLRAGSGGQVLPLTAGGEHVEALKRVL